MATRKKATSKKAPARKSGRKKASSAASRGVESAMRRRKKGTLRSGKGGRGGKVTSRAQAIAIGLSEARKKGAKVPPKKKAAKKSARKAASRSTRSRS